MYNLYKDFQQDTRPEGAPGTTATYKRKTTKTAVEDSKKLQKRKDQQKEL